MTRTFTKDELVTQFGLPSEPEEGITVVSDEMYDHGRWSVGHTLIFRIEAEQPENEAWRVYYSVGATEYQPESPWEYDDNIVAHLVRLVPKTVEVWERVNL